MIDDRLNTTLTNMGYRRIDSNAQGIYMFYQICEGDLIAISVIHADQGEELTTEQYVHILDQIKRNLNNSFPQRLQLLSLILTRYPDQSKHLCSLTGEDSHWIIDTDANRLMIYETQSNAFTWLKNKIEQLLYEEQLLNEEQNQYSENPVDTFDGTDTVRRRRYATSLPFQFTLINSIIIAVNVIANLIFHYTGAFGGEDKMYMKGALSWYLVTQDKEYYRIITSMFMHADWSHLINNMVVLLFIGANLERIAGRFKYLLIYFSTGIVAGIASIGYNMWKDHAVYEYGKSVFSIGASGAVFGVVGALLFVVLINRGRLKEISTSQMILFVILSLYSGIANSQIDQAAHVGGLLSGIILAVILYRRPDRKSVS